MTNLELELGRGVRKDLKKKHVHTYIKTREYSFPQWQVWVNKYSQKPLLNSVTLQSCFPNAKAASPQGNVYRYTVTYYLLVYDSHVLSCVYLALQQVSIQLQKRWVGGFDLS